MTSTTVDADHALKERHRTMWAWGDYPQLAHDLIAELGPVAVRAAGIGAGQRVLDVAAGAGNASLPAAATGAEVVASDLTPELVAAGRRQAEERGSRSIGSRRTSRPCRSRTPTSTPCCPSSARCSRRTTSRPPTRSCGSADPAAPLP